MFVTIVEKILVAVKCNAFKWCLLLCLGTVCSGCLCQSSSTDGDISLDHKIGEMLIVGFRGSEIDSSDTVAQDIATHNLGGVILYDRDMELGGKRNVISPAQLQALCSRLQSFKKGAPLLVSIDQEGGLVSRLRKENGFSDTVTHNYLGKQNDLKLTYRLSSVMAQTMSKAGINLNFAPDIDVAVDPDNFIVKKQRTFSDNPTVVANHARQFIKAHRDVGVLCTVKHFPGHGSSSVDSHKDMTDVTDTWKELELEPYKALLGCTDLVMTAHVFNRKLDAQWPATLSKKIITGLLRNKMKYQGVVVSDDIMMGAIARHYGLETALEKTINAGVDIILVANNKEYNPHTVTKIVAAVRKLIAQGKISTERIDESYQRILTLKRKLKRN